MKSVAVLRHAPTEGPGYFATVLDRNHVPWQLIKVDAGEPVPADPRAYSGFAFMGGPMSVNDSLPWIPPVLRLIQAAVDADVPVIGHCLGGQLMSKALGGSVQPNAVKEIGWGKVEVLATPIARRWFPHAAPAFDSFHWHGETFTIPAGATRVLSNQYCDNQAFELGKHLGMQCHIEITAAMIEVWCASGGREIARSPGPAVQTVEAIKANMAARLDALHRVADDVYSEWIKGLATV